MKQNKIILVAEEDDSVYALVDKALAGNGQNHPILRVKSGQEMRDLVSVGRMAGGAIPEAAYILIVDESLLQSDEKGFLSWMTVADLRARTVVVVLVDQEDPATVNKYQGLGASMCIVKSKVEAELSATVSGLGSFLTVVQGPNA
jgi:hypothetical protein